MRASSILVLLGALVALTKSEAPVRQGWSDYQGYGSERRDSGGGWGAPAKPRGWGRPAQSGWGAPVKSIGWEAPVQSGWGAPAQSSGWGAPEKVKVVTKTIVKLVERKKKKRPPLRLPYPKLKISGPKLRFRGYRINVKRPKLTYSAPSVRLVWPSKKKKSKW